MAAPGLERWIGRQVTLTGGGGSSLQLVSYMSGEPKRCALAAAQPAAG
jgi:hypothetical protein